MIWAIIALACRPRRMSGGLHGGGVRCICGAGAEAGGSARRAGHQALSGRMATGAPPHSRRQLRRPQRRTAGRYICLCEDIDTAQERCGDLWAAAPSICRYILAYPRHVTSPCIASQAPARPPRLPRSSLAELSVKKPQPSNTTLARTHVMPAGHLVCFSTPLTAPQPTSRRRQAEVGSSGGPPAGAAPCVYMQI